MDLGESHPSTPRAIRCRNRSGTSLMSPRVSSSARAGRSHLFSPSKLQSPSLQLNSPCPRQGGFSTTDRSSSKKPSGRKLPNDTEQAVEGRICEVFKSLPVSRQYKLVKQIGEGTFSTVYLIDRDQDSPSPNR